MAVIITTGKLSGVVTPIKGPPFNFYWASDDLAPGSLTPVYSATNGGALSRWVSKIYVSGDVTCDLELKIDSAVVWRGGTTAINLHPEPWDFTDAEFEWKPGKVLQVSVRHLFAGLADFSGNVAGFTR